MINLLLKSNNLNINLKNNDNLNALKLLYYIKKYKYDKYIFI